MSCKHSAVDKGFCYYCGVQVGPGGRASNSDEVTAVFDLSSIEPLDLALKCVTDCYAAIPEDQRNEVRAQYRRTMDILSPIVRRLKDIKFK